jgi:hypothetical protein
MLLVSSELRSAERRAGVGPFLAILSAPIQVGRWRNWRSTPCDRFGPDACKIVVVARVALNSEKGATCYDIALH